MRYKNITTDFIDKDFLCFTNNEHEGNIVLAATDELIHLTNEIRKEQGNTDLVGVEYDNEVYYNFYLMFNTKKKTIGIQTISQDYIEFLLENNGLSKEDCLCILSKCTC